METKIIVVSENDINKRLDNFVSEKTDLTRSRVQKLIQQGNITINEKLLKVSYKVQLNQEIEVVIPDAEPLDIKAEEILLDIVYEDNDIIVVNKPKGMVVHPACGNYTGTLVNAIMAHCGDNLSEINGVIRPGIVHRIDKDTSGILVVAKNNSAHLKLAAQLKEHSMNRIYIAVVSGNLKNDEGTIDAPIARNPKDRKKMAVVPNGRRAVTHYKVIKRLNDCTIVELKLETGRTHQIRCQLANNKMPIKGDLKYGAKRSEKQGK